MKSEIADTAFLLDGADQHTLIKHSLSISIIIIFICLLVIQPESFVNWNTLRGWNKVVLILMSWVATQ